MQVIENARQTARRKQASVVFPEWDDPRVAQARARLEQEGLCHPLPLAETTDEMITALVAERGMKEPIARKLLNKPLVRAAAMVATGQADLMVAGADAPTRRVIEAAKMAIGLSDGVTTPSSFFLMCFPDGRQMIFADCAVNVNPTADELADIARASIQSGRALLGEARGALLSFSTGTSGSGDSVQKVQEAAQQTGIAGPVQADAALNPVIAATKGIASPDANVLVFPSLDAGNIAYKLSQELAQAQAIGPLLQGFRKPVCDLSRGASPDDIVASTLVTIALA